MKKSTPQNQDFYSEEEDTEDITVNHQGILYKVLNVQPDCSSHDIRQSYKILARTLHPDKNQNDKEAHEKFQQLSEAYKILIDENKRRIYDRTGETGGDGVTDIQKFVDAYIYYREQYKEITVDDILEFKTKYIGSAEEQEDLLDFFEISEGDVTLVLEAIPFSSNDDIRRFNEFFQQNLSDFDPSYTEKFRLTSKSIKPYTEELNQQEADHEMASLAHLIKSKNKNSGNDMMANLFAKYGSADLMIDYDPLDDPNYGNKTKVKKGAVGQIKNKGKKVSEKRRVKK